MGTWSCHPGLMVHSRRARPAHPPLPCPPALPALPPCSYDGYSPQLSRVLRFHRTYGRHMPV